MLPHRDKAWKCTSLLFKHFPILRKIFSKWSIRDLKFVTARLRYQCLLNSASFRISFATREQSIFAVWLSRKRLLQNSHSPWNKVLSEFFAPIPTTTLRSSEFRSEASMAASHLSKPISIRLQCAQHSGQPPGPRISTIAATSCRRAVRFGNQLSGTLRTAGKSQQGEQQTSPHTQRSCLHTQDGAVSLNHHRIETRSLQSDRQIRVREREGEINMRPLKLIILLYIDNGIFVSNSWLKMPWHFTF